MANRFRQILPKLLIAGIAVVIVGWFSVLIVATPAPPPADVVDRLSAEAVAHVHVKHSISPRIPTNVAGASFLIGRGSVDVGYAEVGPLSFKDRGGTLAFSPPSPRVLSVTAEPLYLESAQGERLALPDDVSQLRDEIEVSIRHDAVVAGILRQADDQLFRHLRARFNPLGYRVEPVKASRAR